MNAASGPARRGTAAESGQQRRRWPRWSRGPCTRPTPWLVPARYGSDSLLKHRPPLPALVQVSHSRAVAGSVIDGHSVNGADSPASASNAS